MATQHGDLQSVCYLLKVAHITVPQEPSNSNPAILAAYYGYTSLVKELLDSIPGRRKRNSSTFTILGTGLAFYFVNNMYLFIFKSKAS